MLTFNALLAPPGDVESDLGSTQNHGLPECQAHQLMHAFGSIVHLSKGRVVLKDTYYINYYD